jgi:hypothetical protein
LKDLLPSALVDRSDRSLEEVEDTSVTAEMVGQWKDGRDSRRSREGEEADTRDIDEYRTLESEQELPSRLHLVYRVSTSTD